MAISTLKTKQIKVAFKYCLKELPLVVYLKRQQQMRMVTI